jgi:hypothetical protein
MGIDQPRHQRPAREIDPLGVGRYPAASLDHLGDPAVFHEDSHPGTD